MFFIFYNWEMYPGMPVGEGIGKMGYYWIGNPDLKPEKSVNFDIGIEGENGNTSSRLSVFHNRIKDYMTTYYTGYLMDFYPSLADEHKWIMPPDMIYSFKNIGRAEITGVEAEINHQFNKHWSGRLGYTYLHAINKSDSDMPRQLLDRPQHKVDIGVTYENAGWRASLWGNYYIHMLDSNSVAGNGNYWLDNGDGTGGPAYAKKGGWTYQKKTFGIWNVLVQKELSRDAMVYAGIDNIFNHHDDDRALQERVYKFGVNLKFGIGKESPEEQAVKKVTADAAKAVGVTDKANNNWFIQTPFDTTKEQGVEIIGDYRARWNSYTGSNRPEARITTNGKVGDAEKNMLDKAAHGFEQRIRLGVDARIGDNTNVTVLGSASGMSGVDAMHDVSDSKGLNHQRVENIDVTQHVNKWDFSVGRLTEPMGVTGYWFGKEYDGGRAVWTSGKNQVRIGYGDFSYSTGITDSAYTHATRQMISRAPTKEEWIGLTVTDTNENYDTIYKQLQAAQTLEEKNAVLNKLLQIVKSASPEDAETFINNTDRLSVLYTIIGNTYMWKVVEITGTKNGETITKNFLMNVHGNGLSSGKSLNDVLDQEKLALGEYAISQEALDAIGEARWERTQTSWKELLSKLERDSGYTMSVSNDSPYFDKGTEITVKAVDELDGKTLPETIYGAYTGTQMFYQLGYSTDGTVLDLDNISVSDFTVFDSEETAKKYAIDTQWNANGKAYGTSQIGDTVYSGVYFNQITVSQMYTYMLDRLLNAWTPAEGNTVPLVNSLAGQPTINIVGTVLVRDQIPAIDRAAFVQAKHQMGDHFGVQAWYLRSVNDDTHSFAYANGDSNDVYNYDQLANVIGLGAAWRVSDNLRFSFDWGQNRTDFGRMMNGSTNYQYSETNDEFTIEGRSKGGTPRFWVARIDVGHADMDKPGSWNAFVDYKYFQHGSFFGGNGTEALPDRYLDGIKSFTIGGGYVPAKDFLIEAFYTFDAKGIGKRDTLYGPESFTLGDYTRIQATFRF